MNSITNTIIITNLKTLTNVVGITNQYIEIKSDFSQFMNILAVTISVIAILFSIIQFINNTNKQSKTRIADDIKNALNAYYIDFSELFKLQEIQVFNYELSLMKKIKDGLIENKENINNAKALVSVIAFTSDNELCNKNMFKSIAETIEKKSYNNVNEIQNEVDEIVTTHMLSKLESPLIRKYKYYMDNFIECVTQLQDMHDHKQYLYKIMYDNHDISIYSIELYRLINRNKFNRIEKVLKDASQQAGGANS